MKTQLAETVTLGQVYECHNSACVLGSRKEPGRFTSGMTESGLELIYGTTTEADKELEGIGIGEGYCPNCGKKGTPVTKEDEAIHESLIGDDPYQHLHDDTASHVAVGDLEPQQAQGVVEDLIATGENNE